MGPIKVEEMDEPESPPKTSVEEEEEVPRDKMSQPDNDLMIKEETNEGPNSNTSKKNETETLLPVESETNEDTKCVESIKKEDNKKSTEDVDKPSSSTSKETEEKPVVVQKPPEKKRRKKESLIERMRKRAVIKTVEVTKLYYRCRMCFLSLTTSESLVAHVRLVHKLRVEGTPIILPQEWDPNGNPVGWDNAMSSLSAILQEAESAEKYSQEQKEEFAKEIPSMNFEEEEETEAETSNRPHFRCSLCYLDFKIPEELDFHEELHESHKIIPCPHCGKAFLTQYSLEKHLEKGPEEEKDDEATYRCKETKGCKAKFKTKKCYLFHLTSHDGLHRCEVCEKSFPLSDQAILHMNQAHILPDKAKTKVKEDEEPSKAEEKTTGSIGSDHEGHESEEEEEYEEIESPPIQMKKPKGKFSSYANKLKNNYMIKFKCPKCKIGCSTKANLTLHMSRVHPGRGRKAIHDYEIPRKPTKLKPVPKFKSGNRIEIINIPPSQLNEDRPFHCSICPDTFNHLCYLSRHYNWNHGIRKTLRLDPESLKAYEEIQERRKNEDDCESRIMKDESSGRFICRECKNSYSNKDNLRRHIRIVHMTAEQRKKSFTRPLLKNNRAKKSKLKVNAVVKKVKKAVAAATEKESSTVLEASTVGKRGTRPSRSRCIPLKEDSSSSNSSEDLIQQQKFILEQIQGGKKSPPIYSDEEMEELDESNLEITAPPESEQSDLSSNEDDDDKVEIRKSIEMKAKAEQLQQAAATADNKAAEEGSGERIDDNGRNLPPYTCTLCGNDYSRLENLNKHERIVKHKQMTVFDKMRRRVLVDKDSMGKPIIPWLTKTKTVKRKKVEGFTATSYKRNNKPGGIEGKSTVKRIRNQVNKIRNRGKARNVVKKQIIPKTFDSNKVNEEVPETSDSSKVNEEIPKTSDSSKVNEEIPKTSDSKKVNEVIPETSDSNKVNEEIPESSSSSEDELENDKPENAETGRRRKLKTNRSNKILPCCKCPRVLTGMNIFTRHGRTDHGMNEMTLVLWVMMFGVYKCPYCIRTFNVTEGLEKRMEQLKAHIRTHHPSKKFPSKDTIAKRQAEIFDEMMEQDKLRDKPVMHKVFRTFGEKDNEPAGVKRKNILQDDEDTEEEDKPGKQKFPKVEIAEEDIVVRGSTVVAPTAASAADGLESTEAERPGLSPNDDEKNDESESKKKRCQKPTRSVRICLKKLDEKAVQQVQNRRKSQTTGNTAPGSCNQEGETSGSNSQPNGKTEGNKCSEEVEEDKTPLVMNVQIPHIKF